MSGTKSCVWFVNQYASYPEASGITRHFDLSRDLVSLGYRCVIIASSFNHFTLTEEHLGRQPAVLGRQTYADVEMCWLRTPAYQKNDWKRLVNMLVFSFRVLLHSGAMPRPDAIVGSSPHPFGALAAMLLARRYRVRFIYEIRDLWPRVLLDLGRFGPRSLVARVLFQIEATLYRRAWAVLTCLPYLADYARERGWPTDKIAYLPNGIRLTDFDALKSLPLDPCYERELGRDQPSLFRVIYAGALNVSYGLLDVLKAAKVLQEYDSGIQIVFVGEGAEKPRLISYASRERLDNVRFLPAVAKRQVPALLQRADLLLFSFAPATVHRYGISPNKLLEYMASAKPVVAVLDTPYNMVVAAEAGLSTRPDQPEELARSILQLRKLTEQSRQTFGRNGRRYVEAHHDMANIAAQFSRILSGLTFRGAGLAAGAN